MYDRKFNILKILNLPNVPIGLAQLQTKSYRIYCGYGQVDLKYIGKQKGLE